ncbi:unnamed protein product [Tuwongella immobilis]|uniref:Uncharacterized protein n=2 Tax=Tuwongella immobilis TaxID=692036 RepID=A0A6C2YIH3_9BACT|nr:unnamed protein product [Tuwongella immobilis]VTR97567.1 unnamed protein product [Tuwongella immobilis]
MLREFRMLLLGEQLELQKRLNDLAIWYLSPAIAKHCPPVTFATSVPFDFINQHPKSPAEHLYHHYCDLLVTIAWAVLRYEPGRIVPNIRAGLRPLNPGSRRLTRW